MRPLRILPILLFALFLCSSPSARGIEFTSYSESDSLNLLAEYSLFHEYHKNDDFESALPHGWNVINSNPEQFLKYRIFKKMEEILWFMHDSVDATD